LKLNNYEYVLGFTGAKFGMKLLYTSSIMHFPQEYGLEKMLPFWQQRRWIEV